MSQARPTLAETVQTVLVTGAGGFVGGYAAHRLAAAGLAVRAMVRDARRPTLVDLRHPGITLAVADLTDPASLRAAAEGVDAVVHAAADMRLCNAAVTQAVTVEGTRQVLRAARSGGAGVFVHVSTIAVYGGSDSASEDAPLRPYGDRYGDAKIAAEQALHAEAGDLERIVILRPPAVYGAGARFWTATLGWMVAHGLPACLDGGHGLFPYVYAENLADAALAAIRASSPSERGGRSSAVGGVAAYNIVDDITTWADYLGYFAAAYGRPVRSLPSWTFRAAVHVAERLALLIGRRTRVNRMSLQLLTRRSLPGYTAERARRELGWEPRVRLDEGMARSLEWLLEGRRELPVRSRTAERR
jgi:nucleoside-diphosphate-sugar epimerase